MAEPYRGMNQVQRNAIHWRQVAEDREELRSARAEVARLRKVLPDLIWLAVNLASPLEPGDEEWPQITAARAALTSPVDTAPRLLSEDRSEIREVPAAVRDVWEKQPGKSYTLADYERDKAHRERC